MYAKEVLNWKYLCQVGTKLSLLDWRCLHVVCRHFVTTLVLKWRDVVGVGGGAHTSAEREVINTSRTGRHCKVSWVGLLVGSSYVLVEHHYRRRAHRYLHLRLGATSSWPQMAFYSRKGFGIYIYDLEELICVLGINKITIYDFEKTIVFSPVMSRGYY